MAQAQRGAERKRQHQLYEMEKTLTQTAGAANKAQKDYEQARAQAANAADKTQKDYEKVQIANQKEQAKLYAESRVAQVQLQNEESEQQMIHDHDLGYVLLHSRLALRASNYLF